MIRPLRPARGIGRDVDARERPEFVGEMRLIIKSAVERKFRPWDLNSRVQLPDGALKTLDPAPHLGGQAYLLAKDLREAPLAPPRAAGHVAHRRERRRVSEPLQGEGYGAVADGTRFQNARFEGAAQKCFEALEPQSGEDVSRSRSRKARTRAPHTSSRSTLRLLNRSAASDEKAGNPPGSKTMPIRSAMSEVSTIS